MTEKNICFSRLLRIFKLNNYPAFIVELEENNEKTLYISYNKNNYFSHCFESYEKSTLKKEFKDLSYHCLMKECTDATGMFKNSPVTHFEADCSSLVYGFSMFNCSKLNSIKTEFPLLEDGRWMFYEAKIKEIIINFPKLKNGDNMFSYSNIEYINSQFPKLEKADSMFESTPLKELKCKFSKLISNDNLFKNTPFKLKQNCPQYFI